jgi:hypothetical protein
MPILPAGSFRRFLPSRQSLCLTFIVRPHSFMTGSGDGFPRANLFLNID